MTYLLDTYILSKLRKIKQHQNKSLERWLSKHHESQYFISVLSIGEIQSGICKLAGKNDELKKQKMILEDWFLGELVPRFQGRILNIDSGTALTWGQLIGVSKAKGTPLPVVDTLLAATAMVHQLILVTENVKDFQHVGLQVLNPCV